MLTDTRGLPGLPSCDIVTREEASAALLDSPSPPPALADWALGRKLAIRVDDEYTPLATAAPSLIRALAASAGSGFGRRG